MTDDALTRPLAELGNDDTDEVGGKNASLGEMLQRLTQAGIRIPDGFATTARAYWHFLDSNDLREAITEQIDALDEDLDNLREVGAAIRGKILDAEIPDDLAMAITRGYDELAERTGRDEEIAVAVRSSATAEDLPEASFAGQQETFLNIRGHDALLDACRRCYASLFTDRAISYRENQGFDHMQVALSVGVQLMVRSDLGGAGVMFSIDTETGFPDAALINANWGLGETVVQGTVDPDEYLVFKPLLASNVDYVPLLEKKVGAKTRKMIYAADGDGPTETVDTDEGERNRPVLTDEEILTLARWAITIEDHYDRPMDIEWAKDGETGELYIVQARPETVQSQREAGALKSYTIKERGEVLVTGLAVGDAIAAGPLCRLDSPAQSDEFPDDAVLVTGMTDPDWVPIMKRAAAIVTEHGGRTSHAAIVSRELGLPAIVGASGASQALEGEDEVTVSCAEGDEGRVYRGRLDYEASDIALDDIPETETRIMINLADPSAALRWWRLPAEGVGLARMEFIINNHIKAHPLALLHFDDIENEQDRERIVEVTRGWENKADYFVDTLAYGVARIAASVYPRPTIVRMSDFKTNEYAHLLGGAQFEPEEANPMLGWRGASRYYSEGYREGFDLECRAMKKVREEMGLRNVLLMIPFCRTPEEADRVIEVLAENGLVRGENDLELYVMCEVPSNVVLARAFAERFDGFSIGSNDLTQLTLGVDRDSDRLADLFDEQHAAVKQMISDVIERAHDKQCKVGLCGQAPSDHPEFARFLVQSGIDSISVNPDSFVAVKAVVAETESHIEHDTER